jgi:hypothetical protein
MADAFTSNLRLRKPEVGTYDDAWAAPVNEMLSVAEQSIAGAYSADVTSGNVTLTSNNGTDDQARRMFIYAIGTQAVTTRTITVPDTPKLYVLVNNSAQQVTFQRSGGGTTLVVRAGQSCLVFVTSAGIFEVPLSGNPVADVATLTALVLDIGGTHGAGDATCDMQYIVQGSWVFVNIETFSSLNFSSTSFSLDRTGGTDWPAEIVPAVGRNIPCLILENATLVPAYLVVSSLGNAAWGIVRVDGAAWLGGGTDDRTLQHPLSFTYPLRAIV